MAAGGALRTLLLLSVTSRMEMQYFEFIPEYYPYISSRPPSRSDTYRPIQNTHTFVSSPRYNVNADRSQERRYNTPNTRRTIQNEYSDNNFYEEEDTYEPNPVPDFELHSSQPDKHSNSANNNNRFKNNVRNNNNNNFANSDSSDSVRSNTYPRRDNGVKVSEPPRKHINVETPKTTNSKDPYKTSAHTGPERDKEDGQNNNRETQRPKHNQRTSNNRRADETTPYNFYYESDTPVPYRPTYDTQTHTTRPQYERPTYTTSRPQYDNPTYTTRPQYDNPTYTTRPQYDNPTYTTRPQYDRPSPTSDRKSTQSPFVVGVRPATTRGPPITNKPVVHRKPDDSIRFPDEDEPPEVVPGPDVEAMTEAQRRRYEAVTEELCDAIKALDVSEVAAIPLVPAPRPVRVNVTDGCAPPAPLVVGGRAVDARQLPHSAALGWRRLDSPGYAWKCAGALVSDRWVLTAAHCAYQERDTSVSVGAPRAVQLGSARLDDPGALVLRVSRALRHARYRPPRAYHDTALLRLERRVSFSAVVRPACVGAPPPPGGRLVAAGWGRTEFGGDTSPELRAVSLPVWDLDECARALGTSRKLPEGVCGDSQLCCGELEGGRDTCQGDSGGGAAYRDGCAWRVAAVTSLGRACAAARTPAVYALVDRAFLGAALAGDA